MSTYLVLSPLVVVGGAELEPRVYDKLIEMRIDLAYNMPARCELRFVDEAYDIIQAEKFKVGQEVEVSLPGAGGKLVVVEVTALAIECRDGAHPELTVTGFDRSHRLSRESSVHSFLKSTYGDALKHVVQTAGLKASLSDLPTTSFEYLMKADTGLDFVNQIAERTGCVWWVEDATFHMAKVRPGSTPNLKLNADLNSFSVHAASSAPTDLKVQDWNVTDSKATTGMATTADVSQRATSKLVDGVRRDARSLGPAKLHVADHAVEDGAEATSLSEGLLARLDSAAVSVRGVCAATGGLVPGGLVKITDAGPMSGTYPLSRVEHVFRASGLQTRFEGGNVDRPGLGMLLGGEATSRGSLRRHDSLVFGEVTNNKDPEKLGRVKVKFPGLTDADESAWARIATIGAGGGRGFMFVPEVNDEVLLGFERGDLRRPVVLGSLYSKKRKPPGAVDIGGSGVDRRRIESRLGHSIEFGDGSGPANEHITVELKGSKQKLHIGMDEILLEGPQDKKLTIKAGQASIVFDGGKINIAGMEIHLKAQTKLTIGGVEVDVKGEAKVAIQGAQFEVKGSAMGTVDGGGMLTVKGGMVMIN